MPDAHFLEKFPLYRKFMSKAPATLDKFSKPKIQMNCPNCAGIRTFAMVNEFHEGRSFINTPSSGQDCLLRYLCFSCQKFERTFTIRISDDLMFLMKTGQYPAWDITPDNNIENMLGGHKDLIRKGLILESQGFGIGAFGYYRRIVEEIIDDLLNSIPELMAGEEREKYLSALENAKKTRKTSEKIELVQDLMPPILRPSGHNPLSLLHGVLSEGLHAQSDDRCLELAGEVREILSFLASQIEIASESARQFTDKMRGLLEKREQAMIKGSSQ